MTAIGVLASGRGSNLAALIEQLGGIVCVASDRAGAPALDIAAGHGIENAVFSAADYDDRVARDVALADWLGAHGVRLVVTAGYMSLLSPEFIARFRDRIVNVHPSLLPAFPGVRAIEQAIDAGVSETGVTVHLVDEGVDTGRVLLQEAVTIPPGATAEQLHALLQPVEHRLLPQAVSGVAAGLG
ncbi:MAG: phosphoribosylglycinamide formyltransferase [Baekduia sp.]